MDKHRRNTPAHCAQATNSVSVSLHAARQLTQARPYLSLPRRLILLPIVVGIAVVFVGDEAERFFALFRVIEQEFR